MKRTFKIKYWEPFIPPRCRKERQREVEGIFEGDIQEVTSAEAPVAIKEYATHKRKNPSVVYRWFNNTLYVVCRKSSLMSLNGQRNLIATPKDIYIDRWQRDKAIAQKTIVNTLSKYLLVDGVLHEVTGEPRYVIGTYGLGSNHSGTSIHVDHGYNSNIHRDRYFRIDQGKEVGEAGLKVALNRGDTNSASHFTKQEYERFEVLIPEVVRVNPQEHGTGDPFLNKVDQLTQLKDPVVAGLLMIVTAFKEPLHA